MKVILENAGVATFPAEEIFVAAELLNPFLTSDAAAIRELLSERMALRSSTTVNRASRGWWFLQICLTVFEVLGGGRRQAGVHQD